MVVIVFIFECNMVAKVLIMAGGNLILLSSWTFYLNPKFSSVDCDLIYFMWSQFDSNYASRNETKWLTSAKKNNLCVFLLAF